MYAINNDGRGPPASITLSTLRAGICFCTQNNIILKFRFFFIVKKEPDYLDEMRRENLQIRIVEIVTIFIQFRAF